MEKKRKKINSNLTKFCSSNSRQENQKYLLELPKANPNTFEVSNRMQESNRQSMNSTARTKSKTLRKSESAENIQLKKNSSLTHHKNQIQTKYYYYRNQNQNFIPKNKSQIFFMNLRSYYPFTMTEKRFRWQDEDTFKYGNNIDEHKLTKKKGKHLNTSFDNGIILKEYFPEKMQIRKKSKIKRNKNEKSLNKNQKYLNRSAINLRIGPSKRVIDPNFNYDPNDCIYKPQKRFIKNNDEKQNFDKNTIEKGGVIQKLFDKTPLHLSIRGKKLIRDKNRNSEFCNEIEKKQKSNQRYNPGVKRFNHASNNFDHIFDAFPCQFDLYFHGNDEIEKISKNEYNPVLLSKRKQGYEEYLNFHVVNCHCDCKNTKNNYNKYI